VVETVMFVIAPSRCVCGCVIDGTVVRSGKPKRSLQINEERRPSGEGSLERSSRNRRCEGLQEENDNLRIRVVVARGSCIAWCTGYGDDQVNSSQRKPVPSYRDAHGCRCQDVSLCNASHIWTSSAPSPSHTLLETRPKFERVQDHGPSPCRHLHQTHPPVPKIQPPRVSTVPKVISNGDELPTLRPHINRFSC